MEHFVLPPEYTKRDESGNEIPGGRQRRRVVKEFALQKMGEAFRNFKKNLIRDYVKKKKTPDFNGQYEKLKDDWAEFLSQKSSEHFKEISRKNKDNAAKKAYHHIMGPGGYRLWEPKWEKMENDLRARGIPLGTEGWDPRAKSWWYGHGGSLHPETGMCVHRKISFRPTQALIDAMTEAQEGKIKFNREKDALTKALGNDEHPGHVRGRGKIPWKEGFPQDNDPYPYKSRKRKTDRDADFVGKLASELNELKQTVYELVQERSSAGTHDQDHETELGSQQRRSSVASTDAPPTATPFTSAGANAPMIEIRAPEPHYPVDDVKEMKECDLHYPVGNISTKVATGSALPCTPGALHHNNPIAYGYARVTVEDIVQGFEDLEIDYATPEGDRRLADVKRQFILWRKEYILFPGEAPRLTSPPPSDGGGGGGVGSPTPPSRHSTPSPNPVGKQPPPPSPPPAGTPAPNPPPAKKQKQADSKVTRFCTINPEPYVPKTTKVPEPSLKPLLPRPWELSEAETKLAADSHYQKWKANTQAKKEPEPKPTYSEGAQKWAFDFLTTPSQAELNMPNDYGRELHRQAKILEEAQKEKKSRGKQVAQLGTQDKQSIPPLIVKVGPEEDPAIIAAAAEAGMTVTDAIKQASEIGMTLRALLGLEEAPVSEVAFKYVPNGPLVDPAQEESLPPQMGNLLRWYKKNYIETRTGKEYIYVDVKTEHHYKPYSVPVNLSELFQLFNLRELDKSILSCYVL